MTPVQAIRCFIGILRREVIRTLHQRSRLAAALLRPVLWLLVFAEGIQMLTRHEDIVLRDGSAMSYETFIMPGLMAMMMLFNGMQNSLSMVYDREMGSMRILLISPFPRWYLLVCKLMAGTLVSTVQVVAFLLIASAAGIQLPWQGSLSAVAVLIPCGLMLGAIGMFVSSVIRQIENFAGIMNFLIFPMIFLSSALYPLDRLQTTNEFLHLICTMNPFTYAVELARSALTGQVDRTAAVVVTAAGTAFLILAVWAYEPRRGLLGRRPG